MDLPSVAPDTYLGLFSSPVMSVKKVGKGGNSKVYQVHCQDGEDYAIKLYFQRTADGLDRLEIEFSSLTFLWINGIRCIPRPIKADRNQQVAVYEYIKGQEIDCSEVSVDDIDQVVNFASELRRLMASPDSLSLPPASEACFSIRAVIENIEARLGRLTELRGDGEGYAALQEFLVEHFIPSLTLLKNWVIRRVGKEAFLTELPRAARTLSPSDFGFHNVLRRVNGELVFLDFEYFGWDDPVKMIADFLLHPAMELNPSLRAQFMQKMLECFTPSELVTHRFQSLYPFFGLKWCMILLNEFIPRNIERREFATNAQVDRGATQMQQLEKSRWMLHRVMNEFENPPYLAHTA